MILKRNTEHRICNPSATYVINETVLEQTVLGLKLLSLHWHQKGVVTLLHRYDCNINSIFLQCLTAVRQLQTLFLYSACNIYSKCLHSSTLEWICVNLIIEILISTFMSVINLVTY